MSRIAEATDLPVGEPRQLGAPTADGRALPRGYGALGWLLTAVAIVAGALSLLWPAWVNHYPFVWPDSVDYIYRGGPILHAAPTPQSMYLLKARSEIYCMLILPLHRNQSPWPVVMMNALLSAFTVWMVVRTVLGRTQRWGTAYFLAILLVLSAATSLSWIVSFTMPDILGSLLYLCLYLLVFAWEKITVAERWAASAIAWFGAIAHPTHLYLAFASCCLLALLLWRGWWPLLGRRRNLAVATLVVVVAACSQLAVHKRWYGTASLDGYKPPYILARLIADGPTRRYLQKNCDHLSWYVCRDAANFTDKYNDFLWAPNSIWQRANDDQRARMIREEMPVVKEGLRSDPLGQLKISLANVGKQLTSFTVNGIFYHFGMLDFFVDFSMPGQHQFYARSLQSRNAVPTEGFSRVQVVVVVASLLSLCALLPLAYRRKRLRIVGMAAVLLPVLLGNAVLAGVLSVPDPRYQARVIWLLPLLAILATLDLQRNVASRAAVR